MKLAYLFPGQGAQYPQMAKSYFDAFATFRHCIQEAEDTLSMPLKTLLFDLSSEELEKTFNSQLALFISSCGIFQVLKKEFPDLSPHYVAGLSLGEFSALYASEAVDFSTGLKIVHARAKAMQEACRVNKGEMLVILGVDQEALLPAIQSLPSHGELWLANLNCPGQLVFSGTPQAIKEAIHLGEKLGAKKIVKPATEGAFHSPLMLPAKKLLRECIESCSFQYPKVPIFMNVNASIPRDLEALKEGLIQQVVQPTQWEKSIRNLIQEGVEQFVEVGVGRVLTGINRRIDKSIKTFNLDQAQALEKLSQIPVL